MNAAQEKDAEIEEILTNLAIAEIANTEPLMAGGNDVGLESFQEINPEIFGEVVNELGIQEVESNTSIRELERNQELGGIQELECSNNEIN